MNQNFAQSIREGLSAKQKYILPQWHYDQKGSKLFELITELPEYYLTTTEIEILTGFSSDIAHQLPYEPIHVIELGAGAKTEKIEAVLSGLDNKQRKMYSCIEICEESGVQLIKKIKEKFPEIITLNITEVYMEGLAALKHRRACKFILFLGSNIGNIDPSQQMKFMKDLCSNLQPGDFVLIGADLVKEVNIIEPAYNDSAGITAEFNLNLLHRINNELGGNFDISSFRFESRYVDHLQSVESYLISTKDQSVRIASLDVSISLQAGEAIHVESSRKFTIYQLENIFSEQLECVRVFSDQDQYFCNALYRVRGERPVTKNQY